MLLGYRRYVSGCAAEFLEILAGATEAEWRLPQINVEGVADDWFVPRNASELIAYAGLGRLRAAVDMRLVVPGSEAAARELISILEVFVLHRGFAALDSSVSKVPQETSALRRRMQSLAGQILLIHSIPRGSVDFGTAFLDEYGSVGGLRYLYRESLPILPLRRPWYASPCRASILERRGLDLSNSSYPGIRPDGFPSELVADAHSEHVAISQCLLLGLSLPVGTEQRLGLMVARRPAFTDLFGGDTQSLEATILAVSARLSWSEEVSLRREQARLARFASGEDLQALPGSEGRFSRMLSGLLAFLFDRSTNTPGPSVLEIVQTLVLGSVSPELYHVGRLLSYLDLGSGQKNPEGIAQAAGLLGRSLREQAQEPLGFGHVGGGAMVVSGATVDAHARRAERIASKNSVLDVSRRENGLSSRTPQLSRALSGHIRNLYTEASCEQARGAREGKLERLRQKVSRLLRAY
jgi:hypothetical protein